MILSAVDFHGNPYDGHTLAQTLDMAERVTSFIGSIKRVYADLGYRKHNYTGNAEINIVGRSRKNLTGSQKKWYNRRSAIEPDIGHMKSEHRLDRNYLKGNQGDKLNVILSACGYNLRTVYRHIVSIFLSIIQNYLFSTNSVEHCPS
jgi:IS5 family transposase